MSVSYSNYANSSSATNALLAQWLLSSQGAASSQPVIEGNQIPRYLLQSSFGTVEGGTGEYNPEKYGWGDFHNTKHIIKAGQDTTFGNGSKVVDLYGKAFLKPETIRSRTIELADGVFNGTAIPIGANGKLENLSSVFNTGADQYTQLPYINPLDNSTISNAFSTYVFTNVVGSLLTGQPNPLTPAMMTNTLFGFADGDKYQQAFLTNSLGAKPPLESLTAASLNAKVLQDLGQSELNQSVQQFITGSGSGVSSTTAASTIAATASDAELLALLSSSSSSPTAYATPTTETSSSEITAKVVYGGMLSADQVKMMSDTSAWLKQYQGATGTTNSTAASTSPFSTTAASSGTNSGISADVTKLADATQWLRQLSGLGVNEERAKRLVLEKLLNPPAKDYSLKVPSTGNNLNAETLKSLIQSTVESTLQSVLTTILPKLQQLVYYWAKHPPSTTSSATTDDTAINDNSDFVSDNST